MNQADEYAKAIDELNKAIAANPNDKDLLDRRQELYDAQREAIKNAESEKNAIKDLMCHWVYKVRRGRLTRIIIWTKIDLGTMTEQCLFVTNYDFELIDI